ncbi:MAG: hypothetical protein AB3N23_14410 [Paracoccaceae bacterium]
MRPGILLFCVLAVFALWLLWRVIRRPAQSRVGLGWKRFWTWAICLSIGPAWFFAAEPWMREATRTPKTRPLADPSGNVLADTLAVGIGSAVERGFAIIANMIMMGVAGWLLALTLVIVAWRKTPADVRYSAEWYH